MALTQLVQFSVNTVDVLMIARLGPEALAASALGVVIFTTAYMAGLGPAMAISPMVSQAIGADAQDYAGVRRSVRMGLWALALMFPFALALFAMTPQIALALGQPPELAELAGPYVLALAPGWWFFTGMLVLRNFLAALGLTRTPLLIIVVTTLLNAFLNYVFIFGHFGAPALNLVGAGIASALSNMAGFALLAVYCYTNEKARAFDIFSRSWRPDWTRLGEVLRLGAPISITITFEGLLFNGAVFLMGRIGVEEMAAFQVALNFAALVFMIPLGFSMGGAVRVGLAAGAGDIGRLRRAAALTIGLSAAIVAPLAVFAFFAPHIVASAYLNLDATDAAHVAVGAFAGVFIRMAAIFMIFDAIQVAANQALRALKDVRAPMFITAVAYWAVGFPMAAWLGLASQSSVFGGAVGVWWGLVAGLAVAAVLLSARLYRTTRLMVLNK